MKNTCVCIEGQLRGSERCGPTIKKHLVEKLNADLYFVLQNYHEHEDKNVYFYGDPKKVVLYENPDPTPLPIPGAPVTSKPGTFEEIFDSLCDSFNYDNLLWRKTFEEVKNLNYTFGYYCPGTCIRRMYNRYLIYKELKNIKYDWYVILRSDLYFVDDFVIDQIKPTLNLYQKGGHNGLNNNLIVFNKENFEKVLTYIKNFLNGSFLNYYKRHHSNLFLNEELFFGVNMNLQNIEPNFIETRWYISANSQQDYTTWAGVHKSIDGDLYKYDYDYNDCMIYLKRKNINNKNFENNIKLEQILDEESKEILNKSKKELDEYVCKLSHNIQTWATDKCLVYNEDKNILTKDDLEDKEKWYVKDVCNESTHAKTSGSTTGFAFEYLRYQPFYEIIEFDNHLDLVLDEFNISKDPNIFYFFSHYYEKKDDQFVYCSGGRSPYDWINHGRSRNSIVHYANFDLYKNKTEEFFEFIFEYFENNKIDVFYSSSPEINSMCNYMRKFGFKGKVAYLLSNTSEMLIQEDAHFLFENNHFDHICDHMRCWDGGGSFFTCKYRNYHLMDNLAWCEQGPNNEFICTDYFNLASPFVRYWNGDYCKIDNEYKRCECGRLYREFEFLENRPFSLKGVCFKEIKEKIKELGIEGIKQVRCSPETLDVISSKPLNDAEMQNISMLTDKFKFRFKVEAD